MTVILALDIATSMGWAVFDTDRHESSIQNGAIDLRNDAKTGVETRRLMRRKIDEEVCRLIDKFRPNAACLEQPLNFVGQNERQPKKAPLLEIVEARQPKKKGKDGGGPNANTGFLLNQTFAVADTVCRHKCETVYEVPPITWQRLTKQFPGDTKERSIAFCEQLGISLTPTTKKERGDAADASVIAVWCAGQLQTDRMMRRAG